MSKERKTLILVSILAGLTLFFIVLYYENELAEYRIKVISDSIKREYTGDEVRAMIKKLPNYQGDSIIIDDDGKLMSQDELIQSVVEQMYNVPANFEAIEQEAQNKSLPEPYVVYQLAIHYFILQYGDKNKKDSTAVKLDSVTDNSVK